MDDGDRGTLSAALRGSEKDGWTMAGQAPHGWGGQDVYRSRLLMCVVRGLRLSGAG